MQTTGNRPPPSNQANGSVVSAADLCVIWEESGLLRRSDSGHETSADAVEFCLIYLIVTGLLNQALVLRAVQHCERKHVEGAELGRSQGWPALGDNLFLIVF